MQLLPRLLSTLLPLLLLAPAGASCPINTTGHYTFSQDAATRAPNSYLSHCGFAHPLSDSAANFTIELWVQIPNGSTPLTKLRENHNP
ncbi:hypothetical protein T484DRAFT_1791008 [Baffinella frigidus]|nr:hypothetical protein T484DRAFT_1791008 [Cryptophyta sp. CCMP2293]